MARHRNDRGKQSLTQRLGSRADGLTTQVMPDGGRVMKGELADQALNAVGARAMTMDGEVFVRDNFGSSAEDDALYAHEQYGHNVAGRSGGRDVGAHNHDNDPEEKLAQAIQRMVLHKRRSGEDFGETLQNLRSNLPSNASEAEKQIKHAMKADSDGDERDQALMGYWAMRARGYTDRDIKRQMTEFVARKMGEIEDDQNFRTSDGNSM